jgi:hypothetical protein
MWIFFAGLSGYLGYRLIKQNAILQETRKQLFATGAYNAWDIHSNGMNVHMCPNCYRAM